MLASKTSPFFDSLLKTLCDRDYYQVKKPITGHPQNSNIHAFQSMVGLSVLTLERR
ncbi:MAG: hypothetical protein ACJAZP_002273 [Psychromonas sp.]|jgi:hypothetical protein